MARFKAEIPKELLDQLDELASGDMTREMVEECGKHVLENMKRNLSKSFKSTKSLEKGLTITKTYHTTRDGALNVYIGLYGYAKSDKPVTVKKKNKSGKTYSYERSGVPLPLIGIAREYGTSRGERKKPWMRKSFKKAELQAIMQKVQDKYIKED